MTLPFPVPAPAPGRLRDGTPALPAARPATVPVSMPMPMPVRGPTPTPTSMPMPTSIPTPTPFPTQGPATAAALLLCAALAAGCASSKGTLAEQRESFDQTATYTRSYPVPGTQTCEAARRALLSQGYVIVAAGADLVEGRKHFQPEGSVHIEVDFRVVCAADLRSAAAGAGRAGSTAFVNALQERYALKKSANSASVGVGALGSVSLPLASSDDSLVKVASETITGTTFYDRFFALVERYLSQAPGDPAPAPAAASAAIPAPAAAAAASVPASAPTIAAPPVGAVPLSAPPVGTVPASAPPALAAPASAPAAGSGSGTRTVAPDRQAPSFLLLREGPEFCAARARARMRPAGEVA